MTTTTEIPVGTRVQVWANDEIGLEVGTVTADNGTGALIVEFPSVGERRIPVSRIEPVHATWGYQYTRSGTAYLPTYHPRPDMSAATFAKVWPERALPYPWCSGNPTQADCVGVGTCRRDPCCGD